MIAGEQLEDTFTVLTGETVEITHNVFEDNYPIIHGQHILWTQIEELGESQYRYSLYLHDLGTGETVQLSDDPRITTAAVHFSQPGSILEDGLVVWTEEGASSKEIFLYDASTGETTQITNDSNWGLACSTHW